MQLLDWLFQPQWLSHIKWKSLSWERCPNQEVEHCPLPFHSHNGRYSAWPADLWKLWEWRRVQVVTIAYKESNCLQSLRWYYLRTQGDGPSLLTSPCANPRQCGTEYLKQPKTYDRTLTTRGTVICCSATSTFSLHCRYITFNCPTPGFSLCPMGLFLLMHNFLYLLVLLSCLKNY